MVCALSIEQPPTGSRLKSRYPHRPARPVWQALQARAVPSRYLFVSSRGHRLPVDPVHFGRLFPPTSKPRQFADPELRGRRRGYCRRVRVGLLDPQCPEVVRRTH